MKICPECNKNKIEDKYLFCFDCAKKEKGKREQEQTESFKGIPHLLEAIEGLNKSIGAVNNNLYALRFMEEKKLAEKGKGLNWNKNKKCFEIVSLPKEK